MQRLLVQQTAADRSSADHVRDMSLGSIKRFGAVVKFHSTHGIGDDCARSHAQHHQRVVFAGLVAVAIGIAIVSYQQSQQEGQHALVKYDCYRHIWQANDCSRQSRHAASQVRLRLSVLLDGTRCLDMPLRFRAL